MFVSTATVINPDFNPFAWAIVPTGVLSTTVPAIFGGNVEFGCAIAFVNRLTNNRSIEHLSIQVIFLEDKYLAAKKMQKVSRKQWLIQRKFSSLKVSYPILSFQFNIIKRYDRSFC